MRRSVTVALDIGNVCISLHPDRAFRAFGLAPDAGLPQKIVDSFCDLECGRMAEREWIALVCEVLENRFSETEIVNGWNSILGDPVQGVPERIRAFAGQGVRFVYLSDVSRLHLDQISRTFPCAHLIFDGVYSFDAGARKPDSAMYELFESRHGVPDLYFDDKRCNVEAARKRGWEAVEFTRAEQLDRIGDLL